MALARWMVQLEMLALALIIGGMLVMAALVAPKLFTMLDNPSQAGAVAGAIFRMATKVALVLSGVILICRWLAQNSFPLPGWHWAVVLGLALLFAGDLLMLHPMMAKIHEASLALRANFAMLHRLAGISFLAELLLAVIAFTMRLRTLLRGSR